MKRGTLINVVAFSLMLVGAAFAAWYGFQSPSSYKDAAGVAVSSLSIIFGLTAAISSLLHVKLQSPSSLSNDPENAKKMGEHLSFDDDRTLLRQGALHVTALVSIMTGLAYLVAIKEAPCALFTRIVTAGFAFGTTISLLSTLFLPRLFAALIKRNTYTQTKRDLD